MDFRSIIIFFAEAALCSAASAQSFSGDSFSGLIKAVGAADRADNRAVASPATIGGVLDNLSSPATNDGAGDISAVLAAMNPATAVTELTGKVVSFSRPSEVDAALSAVSSLGVLSYLSQAYSGSGFYQAGYWGPQGSTYTSPTYHGPMPVFDNSDFYRPAWGRITSGFGYRARFNRLHKGVDIALSIGDTVRAALPGVVGQVNYEPGGYGNYVVIAHSNGVETRYAHLHSALVYPGQQVEAGEPVALGGNTGNSTGPHLHFETRYMGTAVDPTSVFDFSGRSMNLYARASKAEYSATQKELATGFNAAKTSLKKKSTYVVREGDTVKKIADRAGISTLRLCQLNFITEDESLQPGTMLKLR